MQFIKEDNLNCITLRPRERCKIQQRPPWGRPARPDIFYILCSNSLTKPASCNYSMNCSMLSYASPCFHSHYRPVPLCILKERVHLIHPCTVARQLYQAYYHTFVTWTNYTSATLWVCALRQPKQKNHLKGNSKFNPVVFIKPWTVATNISHRFICWCHPTDPFYRSDNFSEGFTHRAVAELSPVSVSSSSIHTLPKWRCE